MNIPGHVILRAVCGSHAYGMATPQSDIDLKGVYVAPTVGLTLLNPPADTFVHTDPDLEFHEVGKFVRLALKCNPTVTEQLWLEEYEVLTLDGERLVSIRDAFLSRGRVAGAFGGYAMDQVKRLQRRGDGTFSSDTRKRTSKHARHIFRLLLQGKQLLQTGRLQVRVSDPERIMALGELEPDVIVGLFEEEYKDFLAVEETSTLPEYPDRDLVNEVLRQIRRSHL
jgi:predicted nucleotidyltransferase